MRIVVQRVKKASVKIDDQTKSKIAKGLLIFLGIEPTDTKEDINWLCRKIGNLRIFDDENGVMNCSVVDQGADLMVVSQFTLFASTKKGNRPSYIRAAKPDIAIPLYEAFISVLKNETDIDVQTGAFGANMSISLTNDGPVTIIIDSRNKE